MLLWHAPDGTWHPPYATNLAPLHGGADAHDVPRFLEVGSKRLRVMRIVARYVVYRERSGAGLCGEAWIVELSDGSTYVALRDLLKGVWSGGAVTGAVPDCGFVGYAPGVAGVARRGTVCKDPLPAHPSQPPRRTLTFQGKES